MRAWGAAKDDLEKAKQRLTEFLLVQGARYTDNSDWREALCRGLSRFTFAEVWSQLAFEEHRRTVEDRLAQCQRLEQALREAAPAWRYYPVIQSLQALREVQFTVAVGVIAEAGDLSRFENPPFWSVFSARQHPSRFSRYGSFPARSDIAEVGVEEVARRHRRT